MEAFVCFMFLFRWVAATLPSPRKWIVDGTWKVVAAEHQGKKLPADKFPGEKIISPRKPQ